MNTVTQRSTWDQSASRTTNLLFSSKSTHQVIDTWHTMGAQSLKVLEVSRSLMMRFNSLRFNSQTTAWRSQQVLSSLCMFSHNVSHYWNHCSRSLVLAWSLQALKLAEGEVISESYRDVAQVFCWFFFFLKVHMGTFNFFCLWPFQQMMTACRELFSLGATGENIKQLKMSSPELHTMSTGLFQSRQSSRQTGFKW